MRLELVLTDVRLAELAHEWMQLPCDSPMQHPNWLLPWWQSYGSLSNKRRLCVLAVFDGQQLVGLAPWYQDIHPIVGDTLRMLGDGEVCSDHATILATPEHRQAVISEIVEWMTANAGLTWHHFNFEAVDEANESMAMFSNRLARRSIDVAKQQNQGWWRLELPSTWDDYLAQVSKNHRKRCRRWINDYFESGRAKVVVCQDSDEVVSGLELLISMNEERREEVGDKSCFASTPFCNFHRDAIWKLVSNGQAEIRRLYVDDGLVAIEYALFDAHCVYCYQSAMITRTHRDGYGNLSILALIQDAQRRGLKQVDFLRGNEPYKSSWNAAHGSTHDMVGSAKTAKGQIGKVWWQTKNQLRSIKGGLRD